MISDALKAEIKNFWESNPLFAGEATVDPFSSDFVLLHERTYRDDVFAGQGFPEVFFPFPPKSRVLDIGCGPGIWTRELARRGHRASAIDLTTTAVAITRNSLKMFGLAADVQEGDAEHLPFANNCFDGIVSHGVIHHTPDTANCVCEMARVLRPGGVAVVSVYYSNLILRSPLLTKLAAAALHAWVKLPGRGREELLRSANAEEIVRCYDGSGNPLGKAFTAAEFEAMFEAAGFTVRNRYRYYFPRRAFGRLSGPLRPLHGFMSRHFGLMLCVIAVKRSPT